MANELAAQLEGIDIGSSNASDRLRALLTSDTPGDAETVKVKEAALGRLCDVLVQKQDAKALGSLFTDLRPMFATIPKAKTAKIVRTVIDAISRVPGSTDLLVSIVIGTLIGAGWFIVTVEMDPGFGVVLRSVMWHLSDRSCIALIAVIFQLRVTQEQVQWAAAEKRSFLRQRLETKWVPFHRACPCES